MVPKLFPRRWKSKIGSVAPPVFFTLQIGQKPVDIDVLNEVISKDLDGIEVTLRRYGYDIKALSEAVDARPAEIRTYFKGRLSSGRATEIQKEILKLGIVGL